MNNKIFSETRANPILAYCYIEELINEPDNKMYRYYHWDSSRREYAERTFIMDEAVLVNHLWYHEPEYLVHLLNNGSLYSFVLRKIKAYTKAVEKQTEELCKVDSEMQLARKLNDMDKYYALEKNNRNRAEEMLRPMLFGR